MKHHEYDHELTPEQVEALIQFQHDPGARRFGAARSSTESEVELEAYVAVRDVDQAEPVA